jgi:hypothetical protein
MASPDPLPDVATFADRVLRRPLWPHQVEAVNSPAFVVTIAAARRTGKTVLAEVMAMHTAFANRGCKVLILSATLDSARRVTESIGAQLNASPLTRGAVSDDHATRVKLRNGAEIVSLPASQRQVRGYGSGVLLVILDEAGFMPGELWAAAHYCALDERAHGGRIVLCGTPWGPPEHFFRRSFEAGQDADPDHASYQWGHQVNPLLDHTYLARQRDRVSPAEYAAEVLGEWSDAVGALFPRALLDRQTADLVLPRLGELKLAARPIIGLDYGVSFDRSAAAVIYRLPGLAALNDAHEWRPAFVVLPYVWPRSTPLSDVVADVARADLTARFRYISTETSGVGAMPSQEVESTIRRHRVHPRTFNHLATTSAKKTAGFGVVLGLLEQGRLVLPRDPDLLRQLAGLRFEQGERGFTKISAESAVIHDDVADALMAGSLPYSHRGRVLCGLATLADPRRALPDSSVSDLDVPIVATGGGLRLLERPPLQSVHGPEVSLPDGAAVLPPGQRARRERAAPSPQILAARAAVREALHPNHDHEETSI